MIASILDDDPFRPSTSGPPYGPYTPPLFNRKTLLDILEPILDTPPADPLEFWKTISFVVDETQCCPVAHIIRNDLDDRILLTTRAQCIVSALPTTFSLDDTEILPYVVKFMALSVQIYRVSPPPFPESMRDPMERAVKAEFPLSAHYIIANMNAHFVYDV